MLNLSRSKGSNSTTGCRCNRNANEIHQLFLELLSNYSIKEHLTVPLIEKMKLLWKVINKDAVESEKALRKQLTEIEKKIENIEEGYYVNKEMSKEIFEKFYSKLNKERQEIHIQLTQSTEKIEHKKRGQTDNFHRLSPLAVREGFEPSIQLPIYYLSRVAPSTTRTPHRLNC